MSDRFVALLRHGQVLGGHRFRGHLDDPLTEAGWAHMATAASTSPWSRILSSPARRCSEFARQLAADRQVPLVIASAFGERRFGDWEGRQAAEIPRDDLVRFWADPVGFTPPGAEPFGDFRRRVLAGWGKLLESPADATLLVTHGGVIRVVAAAILRLADPSGLLLEVPYACLTRLRLPRDGGQPSLMSHGPLGEAPHGE